uniref:Uncharacterized protein n=1 Tax=Cyanistes caeruleus TaxID=156563 RepID=A0A8C0U4W6_CYACU
MSRKLGNYHKNSLMDFSGILFLSTTSLFHALITALFAPQSAAEYVKSRLPEVLKQHLQDYEKDKENSVLSYQSILEQQILSIDREMLEKLTVSYDEAGTAGL